MYNDVINFSERSNYIVSKLTGLSFLKPLSQKLLNPILFKIYIRLYLQSFASFLKGYINSFLIFRKEEGLGGNIKYILIVANSILYSVVLRLYFLLLKPYRKLIKKLIITTIIIANIIADLIKQPIVYKNLPKDFKLFVAAVCTREERQSEQSLA